MQAKPCGMGRGTQAYSGAGMDAVLWSLPE